VPDRASTKLNRYILDAKTRPLRETSDLVWPALDGDDVFRSLENPFKSWSADRRSACALNNVNGCIHSSQGLSPRVLARAWKESGREREVLVKAPSRAQDPCSSHDGTDNARQDGVVQMRLCSRLLLSPVATTALVARPKDTMCIKQKDGTYKCMASGKIEKKPCCDTPSNDPKPTLKPKKK